VLDVGRENLVGDWYISSEESEGIYGGVFGWSIYGLGGLF